MILVVRPRWLRNSRPGGGGDGISEAIVVGELQQLIAVRWRYDFALLSVHYHREFGVLEKIYFGGGDGVVDLQDADAT